MASARQDSSEIRNDFPSLSSLDYWESTAVGPTLSCVIDSIVEYYRETPFNYGVGSFERAIKAYEKVEETRTWVARLIGADKEEISVYPKNTTEALGMVIEGLNWGRGDEIVGSDADHTASYMPCIRLMKSKGIKFNVIKADAEGLVEPAEYEKRLSPNTKLIVICHASNLYGSIANVKEICRIARQAGALSVIDAAQTVGRMQVNVRDLGCDFLAICGRKHLCGPQGVAALFIRKELIDDLEPPFVGAGAAKMVGDYEYELLPGVGRFNAGVLNTSGVIGLGTAIKYWMGIGIEKVRAHIEKASQEIFEELRKLNAVIYSPQQIAKQVGIISFRLPNVHPDIVGDVLEKKYKIIIRSGSPASPVFRELGVDKINRLAPHYYSSNQDVTRLVRALHEISKT